MLAFVVEPRHSRPRVPAHGKPAVHSFPVHAAIANHQRYLEIRSAVGQMDDSAIPLAKTKLTWLWLEGPASTKWQPPTRIKRLQKLKVGCVLALASCREIRARVAKDAQVCELRLQRPLGALHHLSILLFWVGRSGKSLL